MKRYLLMLFSICLGSQLYGTEAGNKLAGLADKLTSTYSQVIAKEIYQEIAKDIHSDDITSEKIWNEKIRNNVIKNLEVRFKIVFKDVEVTFSKIDLTNVLNQIYKAIGVRNTPVSFIAAILLGQLRKENIETLFSKQDLDFIIENVNAIRDCIEKVIHDVKADLIKELKEFKEHKAKMGYKEKACRALGKLRAKL